MAIDNFRALTRNRNIGQYTDDHPVPAARPLIAEMIGLLQLMILYTKSFASFQVVMISSRFPVIFSINPKSPPAEKSNFNLL